MCVCVCACARALVDASVRSVALSCAVSPDIGRKFHRVYHIYHSFDLVSLLCSSEVCFILYLSLCLSVWIHA